MSRFIVTITPPTPNGDLHIGHLAGPFLSADVFVRAQRQRGHECILVSYSDDYQSYMSRKALEVGRDRQTIACENTEKIKSTLQAAKIDIDHWMTAWENPYFLRAAEEIHVAAEQAGALVRKATLEAHCPRCHVWAYEAFGRGECNYCGHDSDASQCENCAFPPDASRMRNFRCKICSGELDWREAQREFLRVSEYANYLRDVYHGATVQPSMAAWAEDVLRDGPHLWGITRPHEAGLDLHPDGSCRLHTWFLGLSGYMAATREYAERVAGDPDLYDRFWRSPDVGLVHFLGYDCAYSHMVIYPVLLSHLAEPKPSPRFFANRFLRLEGDNLSTSRNHAIWAKELVDEYGADSVRLFLSAIAPETKEEDFHLAAFREWHASVFSRTIPDLIDRAAREQPTGTPAADALLLESFAARFETATRAETFSVQALGLTVLDAFAVAAERSRFGKPVRAFVELIERFGAPLHPELSERMAHNLRATKTDPVADYAI